MGTRKPQAPGAEKILLKVIEPEPDVVEKVSTSLTTTIDFLKIVHSLVDNPEDHLNPV